MNTITIDKKREAKIVRNSGIAFFVLGTGICVGAPIAWSCGATALTAGVLGTFGVLCAAAGAVGVVLGDKRLDSIPVECE